MTYDEPVYVTYTVDTATLSTAAELGICAGPAGMQGRVVSISCVVTTDTTVADTVVTVNDAGNTVVAGSLTVPVAVAGTVVNASTNGTDDTLIPADTAFTIDTDGGSTAGAGTISVVVAYF